MAASVRAIEERLEWRSILIDHWDEWSDLTAVEIQSRLQSLGYRRGLSTIRAARKEMVRTAGAKPVSADVMREERVAMDDLLQDRHAQRSFSNRVILKAIARVDKALDVDDLAVQLHAARTACQLVTIFNRQNGLSLPAEPRSWIDTMRDRESLRAESLRAAPAGDGGSKPDADGGLKSF